MSKYLSPKLETVTPYTPGEQPQDQQYIKLNTNESPYLPSPAVVAAVSEHEVEKLRLYSDPVCTDLLKTAAAHFGLQPVNTVGSYILYTTILFYAVASIATIMFQYSDYHT